jgi:hypothetical protein
MKATFDRVLPDAFVIALASMVASVAMAATPTSIAPVFVNGIRNYKSPARTDVILEGDETGFLNLDKDPFESRTALEFPSSEIPSDADTFQLRAYFEAGALPKSVEIYAYSGDGTLSLTDFDPGELVGSTTVSNYAPFTVSLSPDAIRAIRTTSNFVGFTFRVAGRQGPPGYANIFYMGSEIWLDASRPNAAPTAYAGIDQTVALGETVILDGSGSSDDSTPSSELQYDWSFADLPPGSAATLSNADTSTPTFVADVVGTYTAQLVVTDSSGQGSQPDFLEVSIPAAPERMDFAPVPEVALVQGRRETAQLGIFQLDPLNRWTPGDLTRASGWRSRFSTGLVDVATGAPPAGYTYDGETGELGYNGEASGDVLVRIERLDGGGVSNNFRVRALKPTVVYGDNAAAINTEQGWAANVCETPLSFASCRSRFKGGTSDIAPLVIFFTPGRYTTQDWYIGQRRFVYVLGDANGRATLVKDELSNSNFERFVIANLHLEDVSITQATASTTWPSWFNVSRITQCCETNVQNGIRNPSARTVQRATIELWSMESKGMGDKGNGHHSFYLEMRPDSHLYVNNLRCMGSRGSSCVKSTNQDVQIRHSLFNVSQELNEPNLGKPEGGMLMHTAIDVVSVADTVVYGNEFRLWRQGTAGVPSGYSGVLTAGIFMRMRQELYGSDKPAYPSISWEPPQGGAGTPPGGGWDGSAGTFVSDAFWQDVRSSPITDPENEFSFKHHISFNRFVLLPGSLVVGALRDDGTFAGEAVTQFGNLRILRTHPMWVERAVNFLVGNEYVGYPANARLVRTDLNQFVEEVMPGAIWPRTLPEHFPKAVEITGDLPAWFRN